MVITDEKVCWVKCYQPNCDPVAMWACGVKAQRRCGGGEQLQDWNLVLCSRKVSWENNSERHLEKPSGLRSPQDKVR